MNEFESEPDNLIGYYFLHEHCNKLEYTSPILRHTHTHTQSNYFPPNWTLGIGGDMTIKLGSWLCLDTGQTWVLLKLDGLELTKIICGPGILRRWLTTKRQRFLILKTEMPTVQQTSGIFPCSKSPKVSWPFPGEPGHVSSFSLIKPGQKTHGRPRGTARVRCGAAAQGTRCGSGSQGRWRCRFRGFPSSPPLDSIPSGELT